MALSPILNLPVRWQVLGVDIESLAPFDGFAADSYDVANVNGTLMVENPTEQEIRLVCPFPTERGSAQVRVLSTDTVKSFKKGNGGAKQFIDLLKQIGEIPADQEPILKQVRELTREYLIADVTIPAGQQLLRFHSRQKLRPLANDPRAFELELLAPLAGFILAPSGQSQMAVTVTFPPPFASPGIQIGQPTITPLPGVPAPPEQPSGPTPIAERPTYGWLWRNDPKLTIPYRYA